MKKKSDRGAPQALSGAPLERPAALKPGDTIGVLGFASPVEPERFDRGLRFIESLGFKTKVMLDPCIAFGTVLHLFVSDTPSNRVAAFHQLLQDDSVSAIISSRGGYGSAQMLPEIDFDLVHSRPKILVGFSDLTAIVDAVYRRGRVLNFHGPSVDSVFAKAESNEVAMEAVRRLLAVLSGALVDPFEGWELRRLCGAEAEVTGRLAGGNLTVLASLLGTPWEIDPADSILFFEEIDEKPYRVHRMLLQFLLAGKLDRVRAVVVGSMRGCETPGGHGPTVEQVFEDIFGRFGIPVYVDGPFGHVDKNYPVPVGVEVALRGGRLSLREPLFS